jgi:hypothetical protein
MLLPFNDTDLAHENGAAIRCQYLLSSFSRRGFWISAGTNLSVLEFTAEISNARFESYVILLHEEHVTDQYVP